MTVPAAQDSQERVGWGYLGYLLPDRLSSVADEAVMQGRGLLPTPAALHSGDQVGHCAG